MENQELQELPVQQVQLTGIELDNDTAKKLAGMIASKIPMVGGMLSGLIDTFWPTTKVSLWDQIKAQVEAMVDQKIAAYNLKQLELSLQGVRVSVASYAVITNPGQKLSAAVSIEKNIETMIPKFLSGDPASGFSCFWGLALLHLSVRKDLCELMRNANDAANDKLLHKYVMMYCLFGRVALSRIYNNRVGGVIVEAESMNVPGKNSDWVIQVDMRDNTRNLFNFTRMYRRREWDEALLDERTTFCNGEITKQWNATLSATQTQLAGWAWDAITILEAEHPHTQAQALAELQGVMTDEDYKTFVKNYLPAGSIYLEPATTEPVHRTKSKPVVQLNPFH